MTSMTPVDRKPCPDRFLDDIGFMFVGGIVMGSVVHFIEGHENSPAGHRLSGAVKAVRINVPHFAAGTVAWAAIFSVFDCSMVYIRMKDDPWNTIVAATATTGIRFMRYGPIPAAGSALLIGSLYALIEGSFILFHRSNFGTSNKEPAETSRLLRLQPHLSEPPPRGSSSWFRRIFGGRRVDPKPKELFFDSPVSSTYKYK